jgi:hypothetical protein
MGRPKKEDAPKKAVKETKKTAKKDAPAKNKKAK